MTAGAWLGRIYAAAIILFMISPLAMIILLSFTADDFIAFPPSSYSFRWYRQILSNSGMVEGLILSLQVAVVAAIVGVGVGLPTAIVLTRKRFAGVTALRFLTLSPLVLPEVLLGLALLQFSQAYLGQSPQFWLLLVGHVIVVLPFAVQLLSSSLMRLNVEIESAARTLGANAFQTFFRITLPLIRSGIAAAALVTFIFSFDNVAISLFLAGPGLTTLPVRMYEHSLYSNDPFLAAVAASLIYLGGVGLFLLAKLRGLDTPPQSAR